MSSALDSIVAGVLEDVAARQISIDEIKKKASQAPSPRDAYVALNKPGTQIIAEIKRSSPSKGALATIADPVALGHSYEKGGAAVISVLTEQRRFGGKIEDLVAVRDAVKIPVLRKDFIVTQFQVYETRALGADLMLLIVAALNDQQLRDYYTLAIDLGMNVLVEVHDKSEIERALKISPKIIGVNARNLKTLEINENAFADLLPSLPEEILRVAESGISTRDQVYKAEQVGVKAILVGETLVRAGDPVRAISTLLGK
jgi:indole-3-glycerol phosphate synthase